ncbi:MAG TPA: formylglycine-generating enzyme family protein [Anaerolineales bacterium]|nr:formylglycine-generating enzyme family protein [Anaerolineales bacterium]
MMKRKSFIGRLSLGVIGVLTAFLIIVGRLRVYDSVAKRLPVPESQIRLAQEGITQNEKWKPVIRQINNMNWALVPSGCFNMGSTKRQLEEALSACKIYGGNTCPYIFDLVAQPSSPVCFERPFWIGVTEVTNREYGSSSSTDMISMYRGGRWPRETIMWQEAVDFCAGIGSRLPTEAEWEYAARGPDGLIYPWGNEMSPSYLQEAEMLNPQDVRSIDADRSWVGAHGMSGNVMEWVADVFDPTSTPTTINTRAAQNRELRIVRGGSWASYEDFLLRTTQRIPYEPGYASSVIGFRCVHDFEEAP